jgi:hypothetical protein
LSQVAAYTEVSIRELLQWVRHILREISDDPSSLASSNSYDSSCNPDQQPTQEDTLNEPHILDTAADGVPPHLLADTAYAVYAARFRSPAARAAVIEVLAAQGWPAPRVSAQLAARGSDNPSDSSSFQVLCEGSSRCVHIDDVALQWRSAKHHQSSLEADDGTPVELLQSALAVHAAATRTACQADFIQAHGLYMVQHSWLLHWLNQAQQQGLTSTEQIGWLGLYLYCSRVRHVAARLKIAALFISHFNLPECEAQWLAEAAVAVASGAVDGHEHLHLLPVGVKLDVVTVPVKPFVLTPRVLRAWALAGRFVISEDPLLLVGKDGCGKSEALKALAWLLGEELKQLNITPGEPWL